MKTAFDSFMDDMEEIRLSVEQQKKRDHRLTYSGMVVRRMLEIVRIAVSGRLDLSQNDDDKYFYGAVEHAIKQAISYIDDLANDKSIQVIEKLYTGASLKYVDDCLVAFNREYYDRHKDEQIKREVVIDG